MAADKATNANELADTLARAVVEVLDEELAAYPQLTHMAESVKIAALGRAMNELRERVSQAASARAATMLPTAGHDFDVRR